MSQKIETQKHILTVNEYCCKFIIMLINRMGKHDASKLTAPEDEIFEIFTPKLKNSTYGSDEYNSFLKAMEPALKHHYANNSHHPEHYINGISDMNLLDIIEMLMDWKAATLRHANGDIYKSIEINQKRFKLSDQLAQILKNTIKEMNIK